MDGKAVINLTSGLEDGERVTIAFLMAVAAAEHGRPTMMFLSKEAVRLAQLGVAVGMSCDGCPALTELVERYQRAGGKTSSFRSACTQRTWMAAISSAAPNSLGP